MTILKKISNFIFTYSFVDAIINFMVIDDTSPNKKIHIIDGKFCPNYNHPEVREEISEQIKKFSKLNKD